MADETINIAIEVTDLASAKAEEIGKKVKSAMADLQSGATSAKTANDNLSTSVFNGVAAWDMLKEGVTKAVDFAKGSINEYLDSLSKLDLARANIKAAGLEWDNVSGKLEEFGQKAVTWGQDMEASILSASTLAKMSGGDLTQGINLATLAANLAASGFGTMESNTSTLAAVLNGRGSLAIRAWRLNLQEGATTADILTAAQKKVTMTATEYGDTIPGKIAAVKSTYSELRQEVGEGLVLGFMKATDAMDGADIAMQKSKETGENLKIIMYELASGVGVVWNAFGILIGIGKNLAYDFMAVASAIKGDWDGMKANIKQGASEMRDSMTNLATSVLAMGDPVGSLTESEKENAKASNVAADSAANYGDVLNAQKEKVNAFKTEVDNANQSMLEMARTFAQANADTIQEGKDKTVDYFAKAAGENEKSKEQIANNLDQIRELTETNNGYVSQSEREANKKHILDLRDATLKLQDEMAERDFILDNNKDLQIKYQAQIAEKTKYYGMSALAQIQEDTKIKLLENQKEYLQKQVTLFQGLVDKKNALDKETALVEVQKTQVIAKQVEVTKSNKEQLAAQQLDLSQSCAVNLNQYTAYVSSVNTILSKMKSTAVSSLASTSSIFSQARASGGDVSSGSPYLIGEQGPEMFVPSGNGYVIPNNKLGGNSTSVVLNINNPVMMNRQQAESIGNQIIDKLKLNVKL